MSCADTGMLSHTAMPFVPRYTAAASYRPNRPPPLGAASASEPRDVYPDIWHGPARNSPPPEWISLASTIALANPLGGGQAPHSPVGVAPIPMAGVPVRRLH